MKWNTVDKNVGENRSVYLQLGRGKKHTAFCGDAEKECFLRRSDCSARFDRVSSDVSNSVECYMSHGVNGAAPGSLPLMLASSVPFFSRPRSEGWPHHGRTFSIYLCPLSFWLTLPRTVLSTSWCCPSRPCVAFLACVHLTLFLAISLSPGNYLVSSWCDHSMLASLLWRCLTVPSLLQLYRRRRLYYFQACMYFVVVETCRTTFGVYWLFCRLLCSYCSTGCGKKCPPKVFGDISTTTENF